MHSWTPTNSLHKPNVYTGDLSSNGNECVVGLPQILLTNLKATQNIMQAVHIYTGQGGSTLSSLFILLT